MKEWEFTNRLKVTGKESIMDMTELNELYEAGEEHRRKGRYIEAISAFRQILIQAPDSPVILRRLGECLLKKGVPREAIGCFHDAIRIDPSDPVQFHQLAEGHRTVGDMDKALIAYERASALSPDHVGYLVDLGWCLADLGSMKKSEELQERALNTFRKACKLNPRDPGALEGLASIHKDRDEIDLALEAIDQALILDPYDLDRIELKDRILRRKG